MLFIGITGGVGAGKSEILNHIQNSYNSRVMLTDEIAHDLMEPGTDCYDKLKVLFEGYQVFKEDGSIDRPAFAKVLFANDDIREGLNAIVHPAVKEFVIAQAAFERENKNIDLLVVEAALLIEERYDLVCDELWYIYTSEENRRARLKASRGYSDEKIDDIFASQLKEEEFRAACVEVIDNNKSIEDTKVQLDEILARKEIAKIDGTV